MFKYHRIKFIWVVDLSFWIRSLSGDHRYCVCFQEMSINSFVFNWLQHRFNLTKTVRKYPIDPRLQRIGNEFHSGSVPKIKNHGDEETGEDIFEHLGEGSVELNKNNFDVYAKQ